MSRLSKLGLVLGGYAGAFVVALAVAVLAAVLAPDDAGQASGGMQAFGDLLLFVGLFGVLAIVPTALALWFLRPFPTFWMVLSITALLFAVTGPLAVAMIRHLHEFAGVIVGFLGVMRVLGAPVLAGALVVCALIAPAGWSRKALLTAAAIEGAVGAYMVLCLFFLGRWLV